MPTDPLPTPPKPVDEWGDFPDYNSTWDAYQDGWQEAIAMLRALPVAERMEVMGMVHVGWYGAQGCRSRTYAEQMPANPTTDHEEPF